MKEAFLLFLLISFTNFAQNENHTFTRADSLRGTLNKERDWWDVQRYDITIEPDYDQKTTTGSNIITYKTVKAVHPGILQIDLQEHLQIDSIILNGKRQLSFTRRETHGMLKLAATPKFYKQNNRLLSRKAQGSS